MNQAPVPIIPVLASIILACTSVPTWSAEEPAAITPETVKKGDFDYGGVVLGTYLYVSYDIKAPRILKKKDGKFWSLYGACPRQGGYEMRPGYEGVAASKDGLSSARAQDEPILSIHQEDCGEWEKSCIYQPWLMEHDGRYHNFYNAANANIEQTGPALSEAMPLL